MYTDQRLASNAFLMCSPPPYSFIFYYVYACMSVCGFVHKYARTCGGQRRVLNSLVLSDVGAWEEDSGPLPEQCMLLTTEFSVAFHLIFDTEPVACQFG